MDRATPRPIVLPGIYPDVHAERIKAHFAALGPDPDGAEQLRAALAELKGLYLICFTNRCGSNHLAQCLASDGRLRQAGEVFNFDTVINLSTKNGLRSFEGYLAWLIKRQAGPLKVFGAKASVGQLIGLYNLGLLRQVVDRLLLVHITRKDVMAQAASYHIALRTQQWTSTQPGKDVEIPYQPMDLLATVDSICRQNAQFGWLAQLMGVRLLHVDYERLVVEPEKVLRRVSRQLGIPLLKLDPAKLKYERQSDERNQRLLESLAQEYRIGNAGDTAGPE